MLQHDREPTRFCGPHDVIHPWQIDSKYLFVQKQLGIHAVYSNATIDSLSPPALH